MIDHGLFSIGGLLIDTGFLTLKPIDLERGIENYRKNALLPGQPKMEVVPMFELNDPVVVEWRALTVAYLDIVAERVRNTLNASRKSLTLSQIIQGGTWSVSCFRIMAYVDNDLLDECCIGWSRASRDFSSQYPRAACCYQGKQLASWQQ